MRTFAEIHDAMKDTVAFEVEELKLAFTESVLLRMEEMDGLSGSELAERLGTSKPYVSRLLKGTSNFTFETLVKLARALDCRIEAPTLIPRPHGFVTASMPPGVVPFARSPLSARTRQGGFRLLPVTPKSVVGQQNDQTTTSAVA